MTHSFDRDYWDQIWHGDHAAALSAGQPNQQLIGQVSDLEPGTALDAGCGAGAEAIWLAARGWQVTAADIAAAALARAAERAAASGVAGRVRWVQADLSTWQPEAPYDLVTTHYAHPAMPQLDFYDRLASWVAAAGTLLIVGHRRHHEHAATAGHGQGHGLGQGHGHGGTEPPESASVSAGDITALLDPSEWEIVTAQEPDRRLTGPNGHVVSIHEVVVKAIRRH
jgi:SAM-dependent methyltransferase